MSSELSREGAAEGVYLSVVLTGRNDGYGGDFASRFFTALTFNHIQLAAAGIPHEFDIVEWAPEEGQPLLADLVASAAPSVDPAVCRWWLVDRSYQQALSLNPRLEYLEFPAKNVGIRRARGHFVLSTNCDVLLGRQVVAMLAGRALREGVVYRAPRHDLLAAVAETGPTWEVLESPASLEREPRPLVPPFYQGATGDFVLLDRATLHRLRGFNEVYRCARIGIDRNFLVKVVANGLPIESIGGPVYHIAHSGSFREAFRTWEGREALAPYGNRHWHSAGVSYVNPDTWGLGAAPEEITGPGRTRLGFESAAVPPLVALRRLFVPATRRGHAPPARYVVKESSTPD